MRQAGIVLLYRVWCVTSQVYVLNAQTVGCTQQGADVEATANVMSNKRDARHIHILLGMQLRVKR